ncbi:MAG TPA: ATP-binding protein, partial [Cellvibrio sp.]
LMETVLQNLINNAARYASHTILVELAQTATQYRIAVEDDGPGIPVEKREKVFESFVRLYGENAQDSFITTTSTGGFGLGLAIVKRILQWHGGTATFVEPERLSGARAVILWPKRVV